jgi:hypothetical protein
MKKQNDFLQSRVDALNE